MKNNKKNKDSIDNYKLEFTDHAFVQTSGKYKDICVYMEDPFAKKWMIKTDVIISSSFLYTKMTCHFYYDKSVIISEYNSNPREYYNNMDLRYLLDWCLSNGWEIPKPLNILVDSSYNFWKMQWDTGIVNSEYLEKKHGQRNKYIFDRNDNHDDGEDDEE